MLLVHIILMLQVADGFPELVDGGDLAHAPLFEYFPDQHIAERVLQPLLPPGIDEQRDKAVEPAHDKESIKILPQPLSDQQGKSDAERDDHKRRDNDHRQAGYQLPRYIGQTLDPFVFPQSRPRLDEIARIGKQDVDIRFLIFHVQDIVEFLALLKLPFIFSTTSLNLSLT